MKKFGFLILLVLLFTTACNRQGTGKSELTVTVSIPPFKYFVEAIADSDFVVNVMLPQGADHHSWEPLPGQIVSLARSKAFFTDGYLGFEMSWLDRFREVNPGMKIENLSKGIALIKSEENDDTSDSHHAPEGVDPHYWLSPKTAYIIASNVRDCLKDLNPAHSQKYDANYSKLVEKISETDTVVTRNLKKALSPSFMIFHPALSYLARDYNLEQISFEDEGKDPSPARLKALVDMTREKNMKIILIQAEYNIKSAEALSSETGAKLMVINPMSPDWEKSVIEISEALAGKSKREK